MMKAGLRTEESRRNVFIRFHEVFAETFGLDRKAALSAILLIGLITIIAVFWFFHSAPPGTITITAGPKGSIFWTNAEKYAAILARNGVKLKILSSEGSLENLKRLADPSFKVDIGFVQGGLTNNTKTDKLVSLGSLYYSPMLLFYLGNERVDILSRLAGKRLAIGSVGSGTQTLALLLLAENGIEPGGLTTLLDLDGEDEAKSLLEGKIDAAFMMGESASVQNLRKLLHAPGIRLFDFTQANAYTRRITYLNRMELPEGSVDFGTNIPDHDINLIGPTVELIARTGLHPALSDLLIEAAHEIHGNAGMFRQRGEFPAALQHEFRISSDAISYYKSGKSFFYRYFPFWIASLLNRILVVFLPAVVLLIPGLRIIPAFYRWRIMMRFYRWYRQLLALEKDMETDLSPEKRVEILLRLDDIEREVNKMKVPASFADQFYVLRTHVSFVHDRVTDVRKVSSRQ